MANYSNYLLGPHLHVNLQPEVLQIRFQRSAEDVKVFEVIVWKSLLDAAAARELTKSYPDGDDLVFYFIESTRTGRELMREGRLMYLTDERTLYLDDEGGTYVWLEQPSSKNLKVSSEGSTSLKLSKRDLQVLFVLLVDASLVGASQATLASKASVSQATSSRTTRKLEAFLKARLGSPTWNEMRGYLIDYWAERYIEKLRPKLKAFRYRPSWDFAQIPKPPLSLELSGAAAMVYKKEYLANTGVIELYGDPKDRTLAKSYGLLPDLEGSVVVRERFWSLESSTTVPDLLIYADLMATVDARDREAAGLVRERLLSQRKVG